MKKIIKKSLLDTGMEVGEVYILYSTNGAVRGNHYHSENTGYFYVIKGAAKAAFSDTNSGM